MRLVLIITMLIALTSCTRCGLSPSPSQPLEGKPCNPDVYRGNTVSSESGSIPGGGLVADWFSSECGALGTGATCFVPKGASKGVCRQYHLETPKESINWKQAFDRCNALKIGGYKWRLATVQELESLHDGEVYNDPPEVAYGGRGPAHAYTILGKSVEEGYRPPGLVWSSTCADKAERSLMTRIWYKLTGSLYRIDTTDDVDCTAQSSGLGVLVGVKTGYVGTAHVEWPSGNALICVRVP